MLKNGGDDNEYPPTAMKTAGPVIVRSGGTYRIADTAYYARAGGQVLTAVFNVLI